MNTREWWRSCARPHANARRRFEASPRSSGRTGSLWRGSWLTARNNSPQLHHRTNRSPVEIQIRNAFVETPLRRVAEAPLRPVLVEHGAVPSNVTPGRIGGAIAIGVPLRVQRAAADVKDGSADIDKRHAAGMRLHTEVAVHVDLRVAVDLVEAAQLVIRLTIEEEEIPRRIREPRRLDVIHLFPVPFVVQDVPVER